MIFHFKTAIAALGLGMAAFMWAAADANAYTSNYCREYTRTVYIGTRMQEAYGTACLQPDGDWMIVGEGLGGNIPANASNVTYVIRDNTRVIHQPRVVYYNQPRIVYRTPPAFVWHHNDRYKGSHYVRHDNRKNWNNHKGKHRNDRHHGRGKH